MLVGEQPGDREDREGEPFVGPAGKLLDRALEEAGIDQRSAYVTNAVKHFKWRAQGKRRLHQTPRAGEVEACKPWLEGELATVKSRALVALGATAIRAVFGTKIKVIKDRGSLLEEGPAPIALVTVHPSAVLRAGEERELAFAALSRTWPWFPTGQSRRARFQVAPTRRQPVGSSARASAARAGRAPPLLSILWLARMIIPIAEESMNRPPRSGKQPPPRPPRPSASRS